MTTAAPLPEPIAVGATVARRSPGRCALCGCPVRRGERYALMQATGRPAHLPCIGRAAGTDVRRTA